MKRRVQNLVEKSRRERKKNQGGRGKELIENSHNEYVNEQEISDLIDSAKEKKENCNQNEKRGSNVNENFFK